MYTAQLSLSGKRLCVEVPYICRGHSEVTTHAISYSSHLDSRYSLYLPALHISPRSTALLGTLVSILSGLQRLLTQAQMLISAHCITPLSWRQVGEKKALQREQE